MQTYGFHVHFSFNQMKSKLLFTTPIISCHVIPRPYIYSNKYFSLALIDFNILRNSMLFFPTLCKYCMNNRCYTIKGGEISANALLASIVHKCYSTLSIKNFIGK